MITGSTNGKHDPTRGRLVPHAPSDPDPERDPGSAAEPTAAADDTTAVAEDEARDLPRPFERPPLRPVDWNGDFSRTWGSRDSQAVAHEISSKDEAEESRRFLAKLTREQTDQANARADARLDADLEQELPTPMNPEDDERSRLWKKLENLGRVFDEDRKWSRGSPEDSPGAS
ncbi:hypothetical protein MXD61_25365 [Frankia sp. AgPm24]|uniref:hypothetical protein n=1 Tax=Frankia sp. AgPm24 TaxID=631128 RepID=UPI00200F79F1|nr:hypothetical protein [Frankia sp. AgPm24]MCK9925159.1 hypothetical protein [Frankia sp. AgPm24]